MNLASLLDGIAVPDDVGVAIDALLAQKRVTSEMGAAPPISVLEAWIANELAAVEAFCEKLPSSPPARADVDRFFRDLLAEECGEGHGVNAR